MVKKLKETILEKDVLKLESLKIEMSDQKITKPIREIFLKQILQQLNEQTAADKFDL